MNLDPNVQKIVRLLLKKWILIVSLAIIGAVIAGLCTSYFTTLTYSSSVAFFSYAQDTRQELTDSSSTQQQITSNTSKMNYALKMMGTYIELFKTNEFNQTVANELNKNYNTAYTAGQIKGSISFVTKEDNAVFKVIVTTEDPELSYRIAKQLETSIPEKMENTNNGLLMASVEDSALKASSSESLGYPKKILIGFMAGAVLAAVYVILRDLLDIRVKGSDDLAEHYDIPILGTIPEFEFKVSGSSKSKSKATKNEKGAVRNG
ncbi:MAG: hypothetical protein K2L19_03475 [Eubacterium sp.]|nr:hypothetical protein [Eubacterium sp.]